MIIIITIYLLVLSSLSVVAGSALSLGLLPTQLQPIRVITLCSLTGLLGGCLYCLRAVYLNRCVRNSWNSDWHAWYFLRPIASLICGGVSYLFIKAGLLVLESNTKQTASEIGFFALAFIAGLNVDKFVAKIEGVAHAVWGIEKSRAANPSESKREN